MLKYIVLIIRVQIKSFLNKKNKRSFLILCGLISNYITQGQTDSTFTKISSKSEVYLIRSTGWTGSGRDMKIFVDTTLVCDLSNYRYSIQNIPVGKHTISIQIKGRKLKKRTKKKEFEFEHGKTYYFYTIKKSYPFWSDLYLQEITERAARVEIKRLIEQ